MRYNSWNEKHKKPFGSITINQSILLNIELDREVKNVNLVLEKENNTKQKFSMKKIDDIQFSAEIDEFKLAGIYFYYFEVEELYDNNITYYGKNYNDADVCLYENFDSINKYQITVSKALNSPTWFKEGVLYHIFVDRFNNGNRSGKINSPKKNSFIYANWDDEPMYIKNQKGEIARWDFFGGNLKGIINKLTYLKNLGITIIYLSPIFEAPSNHKYDTGDYKTIDPMFGDEETFRELIEEAEKRGMSIILDGVFSHTGEDSIYFNKYGNYDSVGAYQSTDSPYASWYNFENYPNEYSCWWGVKSLPNVNEMEKSYTDYIIDDENSVISKWMNAGVKGWRLDVADELPSKFLKKLNKRCKNINEESVLIGEVWEDASNKISYGQRREYFLGEELDSVTGYPFKENVIDFLKGTINSIELHNRFMKLKENYPKEAFKSNLNLLGTHDSKRILTELNEDKDLLKLAVAMQLTFEGVPYIYYGDETGVLGQVDPDNRKTYPWKNEDKELITFYKNIIKIRKQNELLISGDTMFLKTNNDSIFAYIRTLESETNEKILTIINNSDESIEYNIEENINSAECLINRQIFESTDSAIKVEVQPKNFKILKLK